MVDEVLYYLNLKPNSIVVDCTCGEGGHSLQILKHIPNGKLICIDRDILILNKAKERLVDYNNVLFFNTTFDKISDVLQEAKIDKVDGILADLGISMFHLKNEGFGFSYTDEASLDMRLDKNLKTSADTVINTFKEWEIADILYTYGEEYKSRRIAKAIVSARPIKSSKILADVIMRANRPTYSKKKGRDKTKKIHPATKSFQALRIFVNKELEILKDFIPTAVNKLNLYGRLVIMSFHSLEDRIVKWEFRDLKEQEIGNILTKKPIMCSDDEKRSNPSARSAKLRCFEKK